MCGNVLLCKRTQLFPEFLFLFFLFIILGINIYYFSKKDKKKLLKLMVFTIFGLFSSFAIHIFSLSSFGAGRLHVSIGMTIGYLFVMMYVFNDIFDTNKFVSYFLRVVLSIYALTNIVNFYCITNDHQITNKIDRNNVQKISEYINKYESENNIEIKYITMKYVGAKKEAYYKRVNIINSFALYAECSFDGIINFYTGRNLKRVTLIQSINQKYMEQIDGEYKFLCIDDILVCPIYNM